MKKTTKVHCLEVDNFFEPNIFSTTQNELNVEKLTDLSTINAKCENNKLDLKLKFKRFFKKYFMEGQMLEENLTKKISNVEYLPFHKKYRKYIGFAIPFVFMHVVWWTLAFRYNIFRLYPSRYELAVTMILGATVAGATAEGGGAIAFPVMTLLLHIDSKIARDFSLMIQSCGMTSASFTILWMRVQIEWHSIIFCSLGGLFSIIFGLQFVDNLLTSMEKKMFFVSIWFAFALSLYNLNREKKRKTVLSIQNFTVSKAIILLLTGIVGGFFSAFVGSGVDISSFSILTILFRVSEKVATPTSVFLMAINTVIGFFWRQLIMTDISDLAWEYFQVSVPVVVVCAPFGAFFSSHLHRKVLASFIYVFEFLALIGFLITRPPIYLVVIGAGIIIFGKIGKWMMDRDELKLQTKTHQVLAISNGLNDVEC